MEKCQGICSYKHTQKKFSLDNKVVTSVEQLKCDGNCLTPDGDTFQLFHTSQITIIMDSADLKRRCTLIRACTLNRSNTVTIFCAHQY